MRPLSLLLVPGMPPSFLTPSPCDVDMTYCESRPALTLTPPDTASDGRSQPPCETARSCPARTPAQTPRPPPENAPCRAWRRDGEKKPGSSRRVRPEPAAKVSGGAGGAGGGGSRQAEDGGDDQKDPDGDGPRELVEGDCGISAERDSPALPGSLGCDGRGSPGGDGPNQSLCDCAGSDRQPLEPPCTDTSERGSCGPQPPVHAGTGEVRCGTGTEGNLTEPAPTPEEDSASSENPELPPVGRRDAEDGGEADSPAPQESVCQNHNCTSPAVDVLMNQENHRLDCDGNLPGEPPHPPSSMLNAADQKSRSAGEGGELLLTTLPSRGQLGGDGPAALESPPSPGGDRIRIELRGDGVAVVSGRETRL